LISDAEFTISDLVIGYEDEFEIDIRHDEAFPSTSKKMTKAKNSKWFNISKFAALTT
jgi:hypothetical protein